ncbi:MAG: thiamine pyrophosphate-binding protein, partial [Chloroflexota bacterium]
AKFFAEMMKGYGVTHLFLVPSMLNESMIDMENFGIARILTHGEKAAAYMADGYARASHRPSVCLAQSVGAVNMATGLQDAYLGLSPVICITGLRALTQRHRHAYQEIEHTALFDAITKFNVNVEIVEQFPMLLRQAFREATSGAPGPVHLDLQGTGGQIIAAGEANLEVIVEERFSRVPAFRPEPELEVVQEAAKALASSERPIIMAGGGVVLSQAEKEVVRLADMLSIPVVTSLSGKGTILGNHPLAVGIMGSYSRSCANKAVAEADLALIIGSHTGSQITNEWRLPRQSTPVIQIDIDPIELGRNFPNKIAVLGDARATLQKLIGALGGSKQKKAWVSRVQQLVAEWRSEIAPMYNSDASPVRPERICRELSAVLPEDALLVADTSHAGIWTGTMVDFKFPGQEYIRSAGTLGWAFCAALGAKCALPKRPVICFTGDGGFWYHIGELETARRNGINTVTIVNNNSALNATRRGVERLYAGKAGDSTKLWQFSDTDFAKLAEVMGCVGFRVTKPSELRGALNAALASDRPAVVDVVSDIGGLSTPAWN